MKSILKLIPFITPPKKGDIVACKQFQDKFRAYRVEKNWDNNHFNLEIVTTNEFHTYDTILSVPKSELRQLICERDIFAKGHYENECHKCHKIFSNTDKLWFLCPEHSIVNVPFRSDQDYEYALEDRIGKEVEVMVREEYDPSLTSAPYSILNYATIIHASVNE